MGGVRRSHFRDLHTPNASPLYLSPLDSSPIIPRWCRVRRRGTRKRDLLTRLIGGHLWIIGPSRVGVHPSNTTHLSISVNSILPLPTASTRIRSRTRHDGSLYGSSGQVRRAGKSGRGVGRWIRDLIGRWIVQRPRRRLAREAWRAVVGIDFWADYWLRETVDAVRDSRGLRKSQLYSASSNRITLSTLYGSSIITSHQSRRTASLGLITGRPGNTAVIHTR